MQRPQLIVFDLDYTLWPFWVDTHVYPPFRKEEDGKVYDRKGAVIEYYHDVPEVLKNLHNEGYQLAIASRTGYPEGAQVLLNLFEWDKYFTYKEMYPGIKTTHFQRIHERSKVPYSAMMFFDDEHRNIFDIKKLDVHCVTVEDGVTKKLVADSLISYERRHAEIVSKKI